MPRSPTIILPILLSALAIGIGWAWAAPPPTAQGPSYVLAHDGIVVPASLKEELQKVADAYFKETKRPLVVTSGRRTPERQAQLLYGILTDKGVKGVSIYRPELIKPVIDAFNAGKGKEKTTTVTAMAKAIQEQVAGTPPKHLSRHLSASGVDFRNRDMTEPQKAAFRKAVAGVPGAKLLEDEPSKVPHFHVSFVTGRTPASEEAVEDAFDEDPQ